jgi:hypothetical protein
MMSQTRIALQRLAQQRLSHNPFTTPEQVVDWLGAVQSQEYLGAQFSLGLRMQTATDDIIDEAFNAGRILRTHVMRPTWHFVTPVDIRWIVELTAPRVHAVNAYMYRTLELDESLLKRSLDVLAKALEGENFLTREQIGTALVDAGIPARGMRLGYIVHHAELEALVCSGPRHGKQFTYALIAERAPQARMLSRDDALAELTHRYFTSHGPATLKDFSWWSGLTMTDAKAGVELAGSALAHEDIEGQTYWFSPSIQTELTPLQQAYLLPTYDEYTIAYASYDRARMAGVAEGNQFLFDSTIALDDKIIGTWRRTLKAKSAIIELALFAPLTGAETDAVQSAVQRYGEFLSLPVTVRSGG